MKLDKVIEMYIGKFGTSYISIPKYDNLKHLPHIYGKRLDFNFIYIDLHELKRLLFFLDNVYFMWVFTL